VGKITHFLDTTPGRWVGRSGSIIRHMNKLLYVEPG